MRKSQNFDLETQNFESKRQKVEKKVKILSHIVKKVRKKTKFGLILFLKSKIVNQNVKDVGKKVKILILKHKIWGQNVKKVGMKSKF